MLVAWKRWLDGKPVGETGMPSPGTDDSPADYLCSDLVEQGGNYLAEMWYCLPEGREGARRIELRDPVGSARELSSANGPGWGMPQMFWLLPSERVICSVRFATRRTGRREIERYFKSYLEYRAQPWVLTTLVGTNGALAYDYRCAGADPAIPVAPRFRLESVVDESRVEFLRRRRTSIERVLFHGTYRSRLPPESPPWWSQVFASVMRAVDDDAVPSPMRLDVEIQHKPTANELNEWVELLRSDDAASADDIGFRLAGDNKIYWLRRTSVALEVQLVEQPGWTRRQRLQNFLSILNHSLKPSLLRAVGSGEESGDGP